MYVTPHIYLFFCSLWTLFYLFTRYGLYHKLPKLTTLNPLSRFILPPSTPFFSSSFFFFPSRAPFLRPGEWSWERREEKPVKIVILFFPSFVQPVIALASWRRTGAAWWSSSTLFPPRRILGSSSPRQEHIVSEEIHDRWVLVVVFHRWVGFSFY